MWDALEVRLAVPLRQQRPDASHDGGGHARTGDHDHLLERRLDVGVWLDVSQPVVFVVVVGCCCRCC